MQPSITIVQVLFFELNGWEFVRKVKSF